MSTAPPGHTDHHEGEGPRSTESTPAQSSRSGLDLRILLALAVLVIAAGAVALAVGGGHSKSASSASSSQFRAQGVFSPPHTAPPLALKNYLGEPINIDQFRGKAVIVTFLYTNCPDVCPLITSNLRVAQNLLGSKGAAKLQIVAVSVDPHGDTHNAVGQFLAHHEMAGRMLYLVGNAHELGAVWKSWGVGSEQDASQPQFVNHTGILYGISGSGKQMTIYPPNFKPSDIAHDVPLLASQ